MADTDDIYYGLGEDDLLEGVRPQEDDFLAGYDEAGYFSIVPVEVVPVEGERHIMTQDERTPCVNLTPRQVDEIRRRMD